MNCGVCLEPFDETLRRPKSLPCGHSYCLACLQSLQRKECPFDRKVKSPVVSGLRSKTVFVGTANYSWLTFPSIRILRIESISDVSDYFSVLEILNIWFFLFDGGCAGLPGRRDSP